VAAFLTVVLNSIRMVRLVLARGRRLIRQRQAIAARAAKLLGDHPDHLLLRFIPGIGPANALTCRPRPAIGGAFGITASS
jgi:hypothetical protein